MTIYIIKGNNIDENGKIEFRFWNRTEDYTAVIYADSLQEAKRRFRKDFHLTGKYIKYYET